MYYILFLSVWPIRPETDLIFCCLGLKFDDAPNENDSVSEMAPQHSSTESNAG
jgi:hypothetical protein